MRTVVLDTNVLLSHPASVLDFGDAEVVIPETVLGELDKLKTARIDPELRFKGREVSRILFELSEQGQLLDGVDLPDGGRLRVVPLDSDSPLPDELSTRNADDRILAVALQMCDQDCEGITLITNDLNMLLKAQTYGVPVQRMADDREGRFAQRFIVRPFQRYKIPLAILAIAISVFAAIIFLVLSTQGSVRSTTLPTEFIDQLDTTRRAILDSLMALESNPNDTEARLKLANLYYNIRNYRLAIKHYEDYLQLKPDDLDARTDYATALFGAGQTDEAIRQTTAVLEESPNHVQANYNLGIMYWQGRRDYEAAGAQMAKVLTLTRGTDMNAQRVHGDAAKNLQQIEKDAKTAGRPLPSKLETN